MTKPTSMNYAAMADAIRKERIGERIEHLRALTHIQDAAERSENWVRALWAATVWVVVWMDLTKIMSIKPDQWND